jgi:hypothetical protein
MAATPKIEWGASFANTWLFPGPLDNPRPGTEAVGMIAEARSSEDDFWEDRTDDETLSFDVTFVPKSLDGSVTGYSTATTGVRTALAWLSKRNVGRFYPDSTSGTYHTFKLIDWNWGNVRRSPGGARYHITMKIRDTSGTAFSEY